MKIELDELEARARAATPGPRVAAPWAASVGVARSVVYPDGGGPIIAETVREDDAAFIAAASPDVVLALIARVREAERVQGEAIAHCRASGEPCWCGAHTSSVGDGEATAPLSAFPGHVECGRALDAAERERDQARADLRKYGTHARFIAFARTFVPAAIARIRELEAQIAALTPYATHRHGRCDMNGRTCAIVAHRNALTPADDWGPKSPEPECDCGRDAALRGGT